MKQRFSFSASIFLACTAISLAGFGIGARPANAVPGYVGASVPWLDNGSMNYGHDFKSGYYNSTYSHKVLDDFKSHQLNIVRVWLFEQFQGLNFSGGGEYISSVDGTFLNNVYDFVHYANQDGLNVEVVCFTFSDIGANPSIITNSGNQTGMVNACQAVASKLSGLHYQMDLCNEGNLAVSSTTGITWSEFHNFIYNACTACHSVSGSWVTMSDQNPSDLSSANFYSTVGGVGCNFYEFHQYAETASLVASVPDGKPMELGECGPPANSYGQNVDGFGNTADWTNVINSFQNAVANNANYYSIMPWCYSPDGSYYQLTDGNFNWNNAGWTLEWWGQHYGY